MKELSLYMAEKLVMGAMGLLKAFKEEEE